MSVLVFMNVKEGSTQWQVHHAGLLGMLMLSSWKNMLKIRAEKATCRYKWVCEGVEALRGQPLGPGEWLSWKVHET